MILTFLAAGVVTDRKFALLEKSNCDILNSLGSVALALPNPTDSFLNVMFDPDNSVQ